MADFDPATLATQLATAYTQPLRTLLDTQSQKLQSTSTGLTTLQSAISSFSTALSSVSGKKGLVANTATFSDTTVATATATASAVAGNYSVFVQQLATSNQVAYADLPAVPAVPGGSFTVSQASGNSFTVDLNAADTDGDGTLSQAEIARAVNQAPNNKGSVTAVIISGASGTQLMLSSSSTGAGSAISVDASGLPANALKTALSAAPAQLAAAQDAIVWMGAQGTGVKIQQSTNTLTTIPGVSIQLSKAQANGAAPVQLTVGRDNSGTAANLQTFIDAYNKLESTLDSLTSVGKDGSAGGAFTNDSAVRGLKDRLGSLMRQDEGGITMRELGLSISRDGQLSLDSAKLQKTLATKPDALDSFFGSTTTGSRTGALGGFATLADSWNSGPKAQIKQRQNSVQSQQKAITDRSARIDDQYNQAYARYLKQFTALQNLQAQMSQTSDTLSSLST